MPGPASEVAPASESRSAEAAADDISLESSDGVCSDVSWVDIGDYGAPAPAMAIEPTEPHPTVVRKAPPLLGDATARARDECDDDALEAEWWRGAQQRAQHEAFAEEVEHASTDAALARRGAASAADRLGTEVDEQLSCLVLAIWAAEQDRIAGGRSCTATGSTASV